MVGRVGTFVSAMLQLCARDAHAAQLPVPCTGVACGTRAAPTNFVTSGAAAAINNGHTLTVQQSSNTATLNWSSFNISADGKVAFNQPSSSAVALNRIYDSSASKIFGSLSANGQLYLINANGILFGAASKVDVSGLIASSLNITDCHFQGRNSQRPEQCRHWKQGCPAAVHGLRLQPDELLQYSDFQHWCGDSAVGGAVERH